jgi:hypothetical protein
MQMRWSTGTKVLSALTLVGLIALVGTSHAQEPSIDAPAPVARSATFAGCSDAAIREVRFAQDVTIDQIRVELRDRVGVPALDLGPVRVQVSAGRFARRLWVAPDAGRALRFSPGLRGDRFQVTLDPSFVGQASTCVSRVDLLQGGTIVASIQP